MGHFRSLEAVFGLLEPRILLAAQPVVEVSSATPFIGESGSFTVTLQNSPDSSAGGRTGFQPYVDLIIPHTGADGKVTAPTSLPLDGVTVTSASLLGAAIVPQVVAFDAAGNATHPFARDSLGNLRVVQASDYGAKPGDQLVVLDLPFGSLVPEQPKMTITVNFSLSNHADLGVALPVFAQGGFAFGRDALDNPTTDAPVLGAKASGTITPSLFTLSKSYNGPEGETAAGPNFQRSFDLKFDVATGQNVLNPVFKDTLPEGVVVVGTPTMSVPGSVVYNPLSREVTFTPNGPLTGVAGTDVTGTINFYAGTVLDPFTGAKVTLGNNLSGTLGWIPIDPRDRVLDPVTGLPTPIPFTQNPPGPEASFDAKSIATQKGVALFTDVGAPGVGPGDTLQYTINIQVSDYFEFQNLKVRDILSDGQTFVAGSARLTATEAGSTTGPLVFGSPNVTAVETAGVTTLELDISGQLGGNGVLTGGLFPTGLPNKGATTLQITYLTTIDTVFNNGTVVSQGDSVSNTVTVQGDIRNSVGNVTQEARSDNSGSSIGIATGNLRKEVYAINGVILTGSTSDVKVKTYDEVTYRLTYDLPQSILGELKFTDFLPQPIFGVTGLGGTTLDTTVSADAPAVNRMKYGPLSADFASITTVGPPPALTADTAANSFTFSFTNVSPLPTKVTTADFLFTVRVEDDPFGDGLKLTNQATSQEFKHDGSLALFSTAIKQITLTEPDLRITKGVIQTNNDGGTFTLTSQGPVTFTEPGGSAPRFTGTINSTNLTTAPINSDLNNIDGRDLVSFGIVVENKGSSTGGAFDVEIKDTMPVGFSIPTLGPGLNLRVTDGAGTALAYTLGSGGFFTGGLTLDDGTTGALKPYHATNGQNIVIITYDLLSDDFVQPKQVMKNTANVENYAAREDGSNYITERGPLKDDATVTTAIPLADKVVIETSLTQTGKIAGNQNLFDLAIGESITYEITATLPEGNIKGFNILDVLEQSPQKLTYLNASVVSIGGNLFSNSALTTALASPVISHMNGTVTFDFADDVYNKADGSLTDADKIKVRVTAYAANASGNVAGQIVTNTGIVQYHEASGASKTVQDTENAEIVEPIFDRTKAANVSIVERDDEVIYTVTMTNRAASATSFSAPAFDMTIEDALLPPQLTLKAGTASLLQQPIAGASLTEVGGKVTVTSLEMLPGETIKFQYTAKVAADVVAGTNLVNTVTLKGDSYPGTPPAPQEQRLFDLSANQTVSVRSPELTKIIDSTSIPETSSSFYNPAQADLVIGEQVTYRIVVTAPEAVTNNFKVTDNLPFALQGGFQAVSASVVSIGTNLLTTTPGTPVLSDSNSDGINDRITFDFGTMTAQGANVPLTQNQIVLLVTAQVRDVSVNVAGAQAVNEAKLTFGTSGQAVATATVDIVEPKLQIVKAVSSPNGFVKPGETVDYTVTVSHLSNSTAPGFDLKVEDLISDPLIALVAGSVSTNRGSVIIGNGAGDTTLRVTTDKLLRNEPLVAGDVWTISFKAIVSASMPYATTITNTATSSFDSLPGTGGRPDIGSSTASIPGSPSFEKVIFSTSNSDTGSSYFDPSLPDLTIGEKLTYRMVMTLPQGLTQNVSITDLLPAGLTPLEARVVSLGSLTAGTPVIGVSGQTVTVTFGNVTNSTGATIGAEDRITIDVDARVKDLPTLVAGDKLTNAAQANFTIGSRTGSLTAAASAEVVEAKLAIDKTVTPTPVTLGETFTYSVILSHQALSSAPAYNVMVQDLLSDTNLQFQAGSVSTSAGVISSGNALGDTKIKIDLSKLMPGEVLSISFLAKSISMPLPSGIATNTATFGFVSTPDTSLPSTFIRSGSGSDSADVQIVRPTLVKTVDSTSIPETGSNFFDPALVDLAIGEQVTYRLKITMPEAVTPTMKVTDYLPFASTGGFEAISASVAYVGSNLIFTGPGTANLLDSNSDGIKDRVSFDFGTVSVKVQNVATAQNQIELLVTARVRDIVGNTAGTVAENQAKLTFGASGEINDSAKTEIVEPKLLMSKSVVSPTGFVKPGETLDYTVTVSHLTASTAPGFDLKVEDLISDPNLALVAGSVTTNRGIVALGNAVGDTTLRITADKLLVGQVWTIGFKALVSPSMPYASTINNEAVSSFDSAPGPGGRPDGGTSKVFIPGSPSFDKAIISTSNPDTGSTYFDPSLPDLTIGEKLTYRMVLTLPQGLTQNVSITDLLPAGLTPLEARLVSLGSLTAGTPAIGVSGQTVTVNFGNVTNSTGATIGTEDRITIDVDARVKDLPTLVAGNKLTNAAQADFQIGSRTGSLTAAASAEVVEAKLAIDKQVTPTTVTLGETFTYSVILSHEAASTAPAYNVVVKDLLSDPNLRLQAGSVFASSGVVQTGNAPGDQNIEIDLARLMPGELLRVSFQAKIETMPLPNGLVSNTATFGFVSAPDTSLPSTFIRRGSGSDSADILVATPSLRPSDQSPLSAYQEAFKRVRHGYWELPIVLAGTAEPGAAVGLEVRDATGAPVSVVGITADVGGHWMAPPIFTSAMPAQDLDALASLRSLAGRQTAPAGETPLSQPLPAAWLPTTTSAPYTVLTSEAGPAFMKEGFKRNMDVTFNGVVDSEGAIASDPAQAFMVEKSASSTWSNRPGLAPPGSLVWNSFARDFAINRQLGR